MNRNKLKWTGIYYNELEYTIMNKKLKKNWKICEQLLWENGIQYSKLQKYKKIIFDLPENYLKTSFLSNSIKILF